MTQNSCNISTRYEPGLNPMHDFACVHGEEAVIRAALLFILLIFLTSESPDDTSEPKHHDCKTFSDAKRTDVLSS